MYNNNKIFSKDKCGLYLWEKMYYEHDTLIPIHINFNLFFWFRVIFFLLGLFTFIDDTFIVDNFVNEFSFLTYWGIIFFNLFYISTFIDYFLHFSRKTDSKLYRKIIWKISHMLFELTFSSLFAISVGYWIGDAIVQEKLTYTKYFEHVVLLSLIYIEFVFNSIEFITNHVIIIFFIIVLYTITNIIYTFLD
jgi:hypothetical protein